MKAICVVCILAIAGVSSGQETSPTPVPSQNGATTQSNIVNAASTEPGTTSSPPSTAAPSNQPGPNTNTTANTTGSVVATTTTPVRENMVGVDGGNDGEADNLADYVLKKVGELMNGDADSQSTTTTNSPEGKAATVDSAELQNCSLPASLDRYCGSVPDAVHTYFNNDVTVQGLLNSLFKPGIIKALQTNCTQGSWCLPDGYHKDIISGMDKFYLGSPFCSDAMWSCLETMLDKRFECHEHQLSFLVDTVLLLCNLQGVGNLGRDCYARTLEAVHVSYADMTAPGGSLKPQLEQRGCNNFTVQMTKTYLCADDVCAYDQNILLEKFETWTSLAERAKDVARECNITDPCANETTDYNYYYNNDYYQYDDDDENDDENDDDDDNDDEYTNPMKDLAKDLEDAMAELERPEEEGGGDGAFTGESEGDEFTGNSELNADAGGSSDEGNRAMLFGLITMTTVLMLGLVSLAFLGYRKYRHSKFATYRRGYSQLSEEESRMLKSDSNFD